MEKYMKMKALLPIYIFVVFFVIFARAIYSDIQRIILDENKKELAGQLGVDINNYGIEGFPANYYYSELTPGLAIDQVHQIVKYYAKVYACGDHREVYYYFSDDDMKAYRFEI